MAAKAEVGRQNANIPEPCAECARLHAEIDALRQQLADAGKTASAQAPAPSPAEKRRAKLDRLKAQLKAARTAGDDGLVNYLNRKIQINSGE